MSRVLPAALTSLAMALVAALAPAVVVAADDVVELPGATLAALIADVDRDDAREVIRVVGDDGAESLEVWRDDGGAWALVDATAVRGLRTDLDAAPAVALVSVRIAGDERIVLVSTGLDQRRGTVTCCLAVHELVTTDGTLAWERVPTSAASGEWVTTADLDGDGSGELVTVTTDWPENSTEVGRTRYEVLRRGDGGWDLLTAVDETGIAFTASVGDTDGFRGDDVVASVESNRLLRLAVRDGTAVVDRAVFTPFDEHGSWTTGIHDGRLLVSNPQAIGLAKWPAGAAPHVVASHQTTGFPTGVTVGSGRDAVILVHRGLERAPGAPRTVVFDAELRPIGEVVAPPEAQALWELAAVVARIDPGNRSLVPRPGLGRVLGGWADGGEGYAIGGAVLTPGGPLGYELEPAATVVGIPLGAVGAGDGWVAIAAGTAPGDLVRLVSVGEGGGQLAIVRRDAAAGPIHDAVEVEGAVTGGDGRLLADPQRFALSVDPATASRLLVWDGDVLVDGRPAVDGGRLPLPADDRTADEAQLTVVVIDRAGRVAVEVLDVRYATEGPQLDLEARTEMLAARAAIEGRVDPGSSVTVDGRSVDVRADGSFATTVDVGLVPRSVEVVATGAFGLERPSSIEVVGIADYRSLPWVGMAAVVTVGAAALLFLRIPAARPRSPVASGDGGELEEMDGDV